MKRDIEIRKIMRSVKTIGDNYYGHLGVRVQDKAFVLGEILDNSHIWIDGEPTNLELNGTRAIKLENVESIANYFGKHVAIINGESIEYGDELGEIFLSEAVVLDIIC